MAMLFEHSLRSLERERLSRPWLWLSLAAALVAGWSVWMARAPIPVFVTSSSGRLEVASTTYRVSAAAAGRVTRLDAELGRTVKSGDLLVELDDGEQRRKLDEARARLDSLGLRATALEAQLRAEREADVWSARLAEAAVSRQQLAVAEAFELSDYEARRLGIHDQLRAEKLITALDALAVEQAAARSRLQLTAANAELSKSRTDRQYSDRAQQARLAGLERQLAELGAERLTAEAGLETARTQLERRRVYAPIAGRIGSAAALRRGDVVQPGDVLATIIPDAALQVIAEFDAAAALGRIQAGQTARIYLEGFSVLEYGAAQARVREVAGERFGGTVRVLLDLTRAESAGLRLRHGLPGVVAVAVESVTPWQLVLRSLDRRVRTVRPQLEAAR